MGEISPRNTLLTAKVKEGTSAVGLTGEILKTSNKKQLGMKSYQAVYFLSISSEQNLFCIDADKFDHNISDYFQTIALHSEIYAPRTIER